MVERMLILVGLAMVLLFLWNLVRIWQRGQLVQLQSRSLFDAIITPGKLAVIAFSTPQCIECRTRQAPALERLYTELGDLIQIHRLSALEHAELADQAGILSVPATLIVDAQGVVRHLNLGFADTTKLTMQLRSIQE